MPEHTTAAIVVVVCSSCPKARQTRFIVSHQHPLHLRPAALTVIMAFQTMTHPLLIAIAYVLIFGKNNE